MKCESLGQHRDESEQDVSGLDMCACDADHYSTRYRQNASDNRFEPMLPKQPAKDRDPDDMKLLIRCHKANRFYLTAMYFIIHSPVDLRDLWQQRAAGLPVGAFTRLMAKRFVRGSDLSASALSSYRRSSFSSAGAHRRAFKTSEITWIYRHMNEYMAVTQFCHLTSLARVYDACVLRVMAAGTVFTVL